MNRYFKKKLVKGTTGSGGAVSSKTESEVTRRCPAVSVLCFQRRTGGACAFEQFVHVSCT